MTITLRDSRHYRLLLALAVPALVVLMLSSVASSATQVRAAKQAEQGQLARVQAHEALQRAIADGVDLASPEASYGLRIGAGGLTRCEDSGSCVTFSHYVEADTQATVHMVVRLPCADCVDRAVDARWELGSAPSLNLTALSTS